jgi:hypothetical protein
VNSVETSSSAKELLVTLENVMLQKKKLYVCNASVVAVAKCD